MELNLKGRHEPCLLSIRLNVWASTLAYNGMELFELTIIGTPKNPFNVETQGDNVIKQIQQ